MNTAERQRHRIEMSNPNFLQESDISTVSKNEFSQIPQARLAETLSIVNTSPKSVLLLMFESPNTVYTQAEIRSRFNEIYGETEFGESNYRTVIKYCSYLVKRGVLNEVSINPSGSNFKSRSGYSLTIAGDRYVRTAAAIALDFEMKYEDFNILEILGRTNNRAVGHDLTPDVRSRILQHLEEYEGSARALDLALELDVAPNHVGRALVSLGGAGLVDYEAVQPNTGTVEVTYKLGDKDKREITGKEMQQRLPRVVMEVCQQLAREGIPITANAVRKALPEGTTAIKKDKVQAAITPVLTKFVEKGFLVREKFIGKEIQSAATITDKGRVFVTELITPLQEIAEDNENLIHDVNAVLVPDLIAELSVIGRKVFPRYYYASLMRRFRESKNNRIIVRSNIPEFPEAVNTKDLAASTGLKSGSIKNLLKDEIENDEIVVVRIKGVNYYSKKNSRNQIDGMLARELERRLTN